MPQSSVIFVQLFAVLKLTIETPSPIQSVFGEKSFLLFQAPTHYSKVIFVHSFAVLKLIVDETSSFSRFSEQSLLPFQAPTHYLLC